MAQHDYNAAAWEHSSILNFFDHQRTTTADIYPSEWFFIKDKLVEGLQVLDIGCAKGGMAAVISEHLRQFSYTGVDINQRMIAAARQRFPQHAFHQVNEFDYSPLNGQQFDLVLCLGILHLHEMWRHTIATAWAHTKQTLILDLRESHLPTIEDKKIAYFRMNFSDAQADNASYQLPYNIINTGEALQLIHTICSDAKRIAHYGYTHPVSKLAVCPFTTVMANVYCIER